MWKFFFRAMRYEPTFRTKQPLFHMTYFVYINSLEVSKKKKKTRTSRREKPVGEEEDGARKGRLKNTRWDFNKKEKRFAKKIACFYKYVWRKKQVESIPSLILRGKGKMAHH